MAKKAQKWWENQPNQEEKCFFVGEDGSSGLVRGRNKEGKNLTWRTITALVRESGLPQDTVERIIRKYHAIGTIIKDDKKKDENTVHWGYFENVGAEEVEDVLSMGSADRADKLGKAMSARAGGQSMGAAASANAPAGHPNFGNSGGGMSPPTAKP